MSSTLQVAPCLGFVAVNNFYISAHELIDQVIDSFNTSTCLISSNADFARDCNRTVSHLLFMHKHMYIQTHAHVFSHKPTRAHIHTHINVHTLLHTYTYTRNLSFTHTLSYAHAYTCTLTHRLYMYLCTNIYICFNIYVCVYYTYMHIFAYISSIFLSCRVSCTNSSSTFSLSCVHSQAHELNEAGKVWAERLKNQCACIGCRHNQAYNKRIDIVKANIEILFRTTGNVISENRVCFYFFICLTSHGPILLHDYFLIRLYT